MQNTKSNNDTQRPLTSAMENYLEAIFNLSNEKRAVRVKDIAGKLGVRMPTVSSMLKTLSERKFIDYEKYEYIELTDKGSAVGEEIHRRHRVLRSFLMDILNINSETADEEACKMEHAVSESTLDRFVDFMEFIQSCPRAGLSWLDRFKEYRLHGRNEEKCLEHMKEFANGFKEKMNTAEEGENKSNGSQQR